MRCGPDGHNGAATFGPPTRFRADHPHASCSRDAASLGLQALVHPLEGLLSNTDHSFPNAPLRAGWAGVDKCSNTVTYCPTCGPRKTGHTKMARTGS